MTQTDICRVLADEAEAGVEPLTGEVEIMYENLTGDDVDPETRVEIERRLNREGINTDSLIDNFVSHQAIHTYLATFRGATQSTSDPQTEMTDGRRTINRLQSRVRNVVENTLRTIQNAGGIVLCNADIFVSVTVACNDCGTQKEVNQLLDDNGCDCEQ
jgi:hypothetical protein